MFKANNRDSRTYFMHLFLRFLLITLSMYFFAEWTSACPNSAIKTRATYVDVTFLLMVDLEQVFGLNPSSNKLLWQIMML